MTFCVCVVAWINIVIRDWSDDSFAVCEDVNPSSILVLALH